MKRWPQPPRRCLLAVRLLFVWTYFQVPVACRLPPDHLHLLTPPAQSQHEGETGEVPASCILLEKPLDVATDSREKSQVSLRLPDLYNVGHAFQGNAVQNRRLRAPDLAEGAPCAWPPLSALGALTIGSEEWHL